MNYYLNQKKTLEINPRHPLIKDLLRRIEDSKDDKTALVGYRPSFSLSDASFNHLGFGQCDG